jgi:hypothetical protein
MCLNIDFETSELTYRHFLLLGWKKNYHLLDYTQGSRDSSVGIELGYELDDRGSRVRLLRGLGIFLFTTASRPVLGPTQPPIQWVTGALSLRVKLQGHEADHSPPASAEVKECVKLYFHSRNTPSWRGDQLKKGHRVNFYLKLFTKFYIPEKPMYNYDFYVRISVANFWWYVLLSVSFCFILLQVSL